MSAWNELTNEQLAALPTHRLYTVYKIMQGVRGRKSYEHFTWGDDNDYEEFNAKCEFVKAELDTREHVTRHIHVGSTRSAERRFGWLWNPESTVREHECKIEDLEGAIGQQVYKGSKKPFKSKNVYNTVKAITINPHTKLTAFTFEEDDSIVDAHICKLREKQTA